MSTPQTTAAFLNTLGVNVHVEYTDGKYANVGNVVADLAYLGVSRVRDAVLDPGNQGQSSYDALASAGIKFDFFSQGNDLSKTLALVDAFVKRHPGAVSMIEGPNEVNNFPISYAGQSGNAAAVAYQNALYAAVKADPLLAGVMVADLTSWPFLGGASDYANTHFYPFSGAQPGVSAAQTMAALAVDDHGKPQVMTEGGYNTLLTDTYFGGVDQPTQAKLLLNLYCDNAKLGVAQTYVYQLLDAYADPNNSNSDSHFGLFNLDNSPKVAAIAIHNLTTILSAGSDASVAATNLAFTTSGLPSSGSVLAFTKSATVHDLLIWSEPNIWNGQTHTAVAAATSPVTLHLNAAANVTVFDPLSSSAPIASFQATQDVVIAVTDHPLVVEVSDIAATTPVASTPAKAAAPAITGAAPLALGDHSTANIFSGVTVAAATGAQSETVTVSFAPGAGSLAGGGFTSSTAGVYQFTASSAAAAQAALRALVFTPTAQPSGTAATATAFTVSVTDTNGAASDASTIVTVAHQTNTAPSLSGFGASLTTTDTRAVTPFAGAQVVDPDLGQTSTVKVTLTQPGLGSLAGSGFSTTATAGVYQGSFASAAAAQSALQALVFTPAANVTAAGVTATETAYVQVGDGVTQVTAPATSIAVQSVNDAPVVTGFSGPVVSSAGAAVLVTPNLALSDPDASAGVTTANVTIGGFTAGDQLTISAPKGVAASFDGSAGKLTLTGAASDDAYAAALRTLSFSHAGSVAQGARTLTLSLTDDGGAVTQAIEVVQVTASTVAATGAAPATTSTAVTTPVVSATAAVAPVAGAASAAPSAAESAAASSLTVQAQNLLRIAGAGDDGMAGAAKMVATVAAQVASGQMTDAQASSALLHLADGTTSVAQMTYQFFTGSTPTAAGLSYLVHSDGNANDLNDAYYAQFSTGNRFINFASNLAKGGAGTGDYHAAYDGLSLQDATAKAYTSVFGAAPTADKVATLLNAQVPDGHGGVETRADYFAAYGGDGANGTGTKAAMIGWLLSEAVAEDVGPYAAAETHFLQDLAHGTAQFGVNLLGAYAAAPTLVGQATTDSHLGG